MGSEALTPDLSRPGRLVSVWFVNSSRSFEGLRAPKEEHMFRTAVYVRFALLMGVLVAVAMFMGSDPWGPG